MKISVNTLDSLAITRLGARSEYFSKAARDDPDSPHAVTWVGFATLLAGEARVLAQAQHAMIEGLFGGRGLVDLGDASEPTVTNNGQRT